MRSEIEAMLSHLGEADQSLLRLRLGGMPWDDVAAATGLTAQDCRQRWGRLIRQIRTRRVRICDQTLQTHREGRAAARKRTNSS